MRPTLRFACLTAAALLTLSGVARGQGAQNAPPKAPSRIGLRAYAIVDLDAVAAKASFDAALRNSHLNAFGAGVDVTGIWKHVFARVAFTRARETGSRVFVNNGEVFQLGIPLTITLTPIEAGAGWRFVSKKGSRVTPYAGLAFLSMGYTEVSSFAQSGEDTSGRFKGQALFGGVDAAIVKWLFASGEVQYRRVPHALGAGGVSKDFNESDIGGVTARLTIGIRTKR